MPLAGLAKAWQSGSVTLQRLPLSPVTHSPQRARVLTQVPAHCTAPNSWADSELSAASQANAKTNLVIISGNPAHYHLLNYPINSTSWESLFATQANVCSQISRQEDSSIVQTQGFDNAERAGLVADRHRKKTEECSSLHPHTPHTHSHSYTLRNESKRTTRG